MLEFSSFYNTKIIISNESFTIKTLDPKHRILDGIEKLNLKDIHLLALVTATSSEVLFYATVGDKYGQSNELAEQGVIDALALERFYKTVTEVVRKSTSFNSDMLNVLKMSPDLTCKIIYVPKNTRVYSLKKAWESSVSKKNLEKNNARI